MMMMMMMRMIASYDLAPSDKSFSVSYASRQCCSFIKKFRLEVVSVCHHVMTTTVTVAVAR